MKVKTTGKNVIVIGDANVIPGAPAVEIGKEWEKHPHVKDMIEKEVLVVVKDDDVSEETKQPPADGK